MSHTSLTLIAGYAATWHRVAGQSVVFVEEPGAASGVDAPRVIVFDYRHEDAAEKFRAAHPDLAPVAVVPGVEYAVPFAARLAELYGVPGAGHAAARTLRDKWLLRQAVAEGPVAGPRSWQVSGPEEVRALMARHGAPMILKPANHQGSIGTQVVRTPADIDAVWTACVEEDQVSDGILPVRMLAEEFVEGPEFSVELLVQQGAVLFANVTGKYLYPGVRPVEQGHVVPADIPAGLRARLVGDTERLLRAVGFGTGVAHCEWIVRDGTPYLVECAGRIPGDWIAGLIDLAYGIDTIGQYLAIMRGERPSRIPDRPLGGSAVWFLDAAAGRIDTISGVGAARGSPGVLTVELLARAGDTARPPRSGRDRPGFVVTAAATAAEALRRAREAAGHIRIETTPGAAG